MTKEVVASASAMAQKRDELHRDLPHIDPLLMKPDLVRIPKP